MVEERDLRGNFGFWQGVIFNGGGCPQEVAVRKDRRPKTSKPVTRFQRAGLFCLDYGLDFIGRYRNLRLRRRAASAY
jgi:hypothetical protein